jgi:uroporphyrinogen-III decarboxylase
MDTYERVVTALNFQEPDRVPVYQMLSSMELIDQFGGSGSFMERVAHAHRTLGIDCCIYFPNPHGDWITETLRSWGQFLGIDVAEWEVQPGSDTGWIKKRPFDDLDSLAAHLPPRPDKAAVGRSFLDWYVPTRDALMPDTVFFGTCMGCVAHSYMYGGQKLFFIATKRAPELAQHLLDVFADWALGVTTAYAENELGPAFHLADDIAHSTSLLVSPEFLRREHFPRLRRIIAPLKEKDIKVIYHSDGDLSRILDGLVNEVGIDGIHPVEPVAGMDIFEIRRRYPKLILCGNLDFVNILSRAAPEVVTAGVERLMRGLGPGGGYLFGASSDITAKVPPENVAAMFEAVQRFGQYPIALASD